MTNFYLKHYHLKFNLAKILLTYQSFIFYEEKKNFLEQGQALEQGDEEKDKRWKQEGLYKKSTAFEGYEQKVKKIMAEPCIQKACLQEKQGILEKPPKHQERV